MRTRHLLPLVALSLGVGLAACGGDDSGSGGSDTPAAASTATTAAGPGAAALAYAECMREHDVDFPDPQIGADGSVMMTAGANGNADDPDMPEAREACADLLQQGGQGADVDPEREAEMQDQALAFAQCMRENGVPDFPDPQVDGGRVLMGGGGGDPNSPAFQSAIETCQGTSGLGGGSQP